MTRSSLPVRGWLLAAALGAAGCAASPAPVDLGGGWPARGDDYAETTARWTRSASDGSAFTMVVEARATLKSPAWRAAYVEQRARREGLSASGKAELEKTEKAAAAAAHEIELLFATYDRRSNDLSKGARSIWRLTLVGDDGQEVRPIEVVRDRRPRTEIQAYFPHLGDFDQAYVARFPADAKIFGDGARRVVLRIASGQGSVALTWHDD